MVPGAESHSGKIVERYQAFQRTQFDGCTVVYTVNVTLCSLIPNAVHFLFISS